jgi:hypothetical protein
MSVLMTVNHEHEVGGSQCRVEWQGVVAGDEVTARLVTGQGPDAVFPSTPVSGIRPQPYVEDAWLLDLAQLPPGWRQLDLVVKAPTVHPVSLALEVRQPGGGADVLHHSGLVTVSDAPLVALRITPAAVGWTVVPYDAVFADDDHDPVPPASVPESLWEPAGVALRENVVRRGESVTAVVDLSASMRPQLTAGTVGCVLSALQAVAGAAGQQGVAVVAVSDTVHDRRMLPLADDPEEFLRRWTHEIGLRTGRHGTADRWISESAPSGLVVSVGDQVAGAGPARGYRVVLTAAAPDRPVTGRDGVVTVSEPRPGAVAVVRALAHASPAA